jgi:hypothetical protein
MADNVVANPGSGGATFATDDDTVAHHPYVKLEYGDDGTFTKVATGASALPVQDGGNSLTVDGTVTVNAGTNLNTSALAVEAGGNLAAIKAKTDNIPVQGQALAAASVPVVLTAAQLTTLTPPAAITGYATDTVQTANGVLIGAVTESAPAGDTSSSGLNGRLQRIAQRLTTILASTLGFSVGAGNVDATTMRVVTANDGMLNTNIGTVTETAPTTDTASSGLNGRLQRIAQRITSLIALLPSALISGRLDVNLGAAPAVVTITHGKTIKTASGSLTADTDVIAAVSSKRIKVIAYSFISVGTSATTVIFKSNGTSGTELWRLLMQSSTAIAAGANLAISAPSFLFATVAGEKLTVDVNAADTIHYSITYFDDDAA